MRQRHGYQATIMIHVRHLGGVHGFLLDGVVEQEEPRDRGCGVLLQARDLRLERVPDLQPSVSDNVISVNTIDVALSA